MTVKVLVVEESTLLRQRLVSLLSEIVGVEAIGLAQGLPETLDVICCLEPQIVLMDIHLSKGRGVSMMKRIREQHRALTIIALTDDSSALYQARCLEAGADFFLDKATELVKTKKIIIDLLKQFAPIEDKSDEDASLLRALGEAAT